MSRWHKEKEKIRQQAMQAQGDNRQEPHKEDDPALPFQRVTSFKLLGLVLDQVWSFGGHMNDTQRKMKLRTAILQKVSNSVWGLENRILTITVHALLESIINYGLTVIGSAASTEDFESVEKTVLNPVARKVAGGGILCKARNPVSIGGYEIGAQPLSAESSKRSGQDPAGQ